jgi:thiamine-phosphate pyrophosphorylase
LKGYYFITDSALSRNGNRADVSAALAQNVGVIQYRCKDMPAGRMYDEALALRILIDDSGTKVKFIINDRVDIALAVNADGVHLGQDDLGCTPARRLLGPAKIIGVTVHSLQEALLAQKEGADYIATSPVFETNTKDDAGPAVGTRLITEMKSHVSLPVIAIGGINHSNARRAIAAGADMICAISAVVASSDASEAIRRFQEMFT